MIELLESAERALKEGRVAAAIEGYEEALAGGIEGTSLLLRQLAPLYVTTRRPLRALEAAQALVYFQPKDPEAWLILSSTQEKLGLNHEALRSIYRAMELRPSDRLLVNNMLYLLSALYTPFDYAVEAERWAPETSMRLRGQSRSLRRIGYVSGDFKFHVMDRVIEPLLRYSQVEVVCYDNTPKQDKRSDELRQWGTQWKYIRGLKAEAIAQQVVKDKIDVLVDLSGLSAGNRLDVFQLQPAPLQITMAGYLPTTGYRCFDYRIADVEEQDQYIEPLCKMDSAVAPMPLCPEIAVSELPAKRNGYITFGYVNGLRKLTQEFIEQAISAVRAVPGSKLLVMTVGASEPECVTSLLRRFGPIQDRVIFTESCGGAAFCRLFSEIDVALDPFPYGGCMTTFDTLYHGVPVICTRGDRRIAADGARLQLGVGLGQFVARDGDYARVAREVTEDLDRLASVRAQLRSRLQQHAAGKPEAWVRELEAAFAKLLRSNSFRGAA